MSDGKSVIKTEFLAEESPSTSEFLNVSTEEDPPINSNLLSSSDVHPNIAENSSNFENNQTSIQPETTAIINEHSSASAIRVKEEGECSLNQSGGGNASFDWSEFQIVDELAEDDQCESSAAAVTSTLSSDVRKHTVSSTNSESLSKVSPAASLPQVSFAKNISSFIQPAKTRSADKNSGKRSGQQRKPADAERRDQELKSSSSSKRNSHKTQISTAAPSLGPSPSKKTRPSKSDSQQKPNSNHETLGPSKLSSTKPSNSDQSALSMNSIDGVTVIHSKSTTDIHPKSVIKEEPPVEHLQSVTPRKGPPESVIAYVNSMLNLQYEPSKYTAFFCNACQSLLTTTGEYEGHLAGQLHKAQVHLWRQAHKLIQASTVIKAKCDSALMTKLNAEKDTVIVGTNHLVEVVDEANEALYSVCTLCLVSYTQYETLLQHLSSFKHCNAAMELCRPDQYEPPGLEQDVDGTKRRCYSEERQTRIIGKVKHYVLKHGLALSRKLIVNSPELNRFRQFPMDENDESNVEAEEANVIEAMHALFSVQHSEGHHLQYSVIPVQRSVLNSDFAKFGVKKFNAAVGVQYLLELWQPCPSTTPMYYCMLCDYLVTKWLMHCATLKHCLTYFRKHYKAVYHCVIDNSTDIMDLRKMLTMGREKVLELEGRQLNCGWTDLFAAINARIAAEIVDREQMEVPPPNRCFSAHGCNREVNDKLEWKSEQTNKNLKSGDKSTNKLRPVLVNQRGSHVESKRSMFIPYKQRVKHQRIEYCHDRITTPVPLFPKSVTKRSEIDKRININNNMVNSDVVRDTRTGHHRLSVSSRSSTSNMARGKFRSNDRRPPADRNRSPSSSQGEVRTQHRRRSSPRSKRSDYSHTSKGRVSADGFRGQTGSRSRSRSRKRYSDERSFQSTSCSSSDGNRRGYSEDKDTHKHRLNIPHLSGAELLRLEHMLRTIGCEFDGDLNISDLIRLREKLLPGQLDELITLLIQERAKDDFERERLKREAMHPELMGTQSSSHQNLVSNNNNSVTGVVADSNIQAINQQQLQHNYLINSTFSTTSTTGTHNSTSTNIGISSAAVMAKRHPLLLTAEESKLANRPEFRDQPPQPPYNW